MSSSSPRNSPVQTSHPDRGEIRRRFHERQQAAQRGSQENEPAANEFGKSVEFVLFLCGYFNAGYLGYEAAEGMDWIWEHRIEDMKQLGL